jgi:branched-chain amino acid aminotransferase
VASLKAQVKAHEEGYSQVLWLDGIHRKYIEEVGAMNIFFKINNKIITPELCGSILPGVTRDSVIRLCKDWGMEVEERRISIDEISLAHQRGLLEEVFGTGTAAVISPVGHLRWGSQIMQVKDGGIGEVSQRLYNSLTGIQLGDITDVYNWTVEV